MTKGDFVMSYYWDDVEVDDEVEAEAEKEKKRRDAEREEEERRKKDDDFKPGSDMHTWATTRFF